MMGAVTSYLLVILVLGSCAGGTGTPDSQQTTSRWSDPATWASGVVPQANDSVHIPAGQTIVLDTLTANLDLLRIEGSLVADSASDVGITANTIQVMNTGVLEVGSETAPFRKTAIITLTGARSQHVSRSEDNGLDNDGLTRGLQVFGGGRLTLVGAVPPLLKTKLNAHAAGGATTFTLADPVDWRAGDRIAISTTDFHGVGETEVLMLASDTSGVFMETTTGLQTARWGAMQYPLDAAVNGSAVSLVRGTFTQQTPLTPDELDERAEVVNLSRRIVIQGADDAAWANSGFGAHVMVMGLLSTAQVRGVEFRRVGQRQAMGRYPFHWHMLSYTPASPTGQGGGVHIGDADPNKHYLIDCAIWRSENRAVTIHGTCGVNVENVYAVDIKGHAFFMEDGSEQRNTIRNSLAMKVKDPGSHRIKANDEFASGFWLTNPDNTIVGNSASDCSGRGLWNSFAARCFGLSRNAGVEPVFIPIRMFDDNTGHGNRQQGIMTDNPVVDEAGNTGGQRYLERYTTGQVHEFTMRRNKVWKNLGGGYQNRVMRAHYEAWTAADNNGRDFQGSSLGGAIMSSALLIGASLNNGTPFPNSRRTAIASYHHEMNFVDMTAINYPYRGPTMTGNGQFVYGGGVFDSSDLYVYAIGLGHKRNQRWNLINSHAGYITPPPYFDGFPLQVGSGFRYWSLPGAIWDPHGYWSSAAGNYIVPNVPFYAYGLTSSSPVPQTQMLSTPDVFYGVNLIQVDNDQQYISSLRTMRMARLDNNNSEVAHHLIGSPTQSLFLPGFRHFTVAQNGRYRMTFPGESLPTRSLFMELHNAYRATDTFVIGLPWPGSIPAAGRVHSGYGADPVAGVSQGRVRHFQRTGSNLNDVLADPTGRVMWQDAANNTVWIKHVGGLVWQSGAAPDSDQDLARPQLLYIVPGT